MLPGVVLSKLTLPIPTESTEQKLLVQWLNLQGIKHFRVPNETYTKSYKQKVTNKALGVVPGVPDLFVAIPHVGLLAIEMKRIKRSVTSPAQKEWIELLNTLPGVQAFVCFGFEDARRTIESFIIIQPSPGQQRAELPF